MAHLRRFPEGLLVRSLARSVVTRWECKAFQELGLSGLYALMTLRQEVFVVEQHCAYQDADGLDIQAHHQMAWRPMPGQSLEALVACARILPPGLRYEQASIGRVVTAAQARGQGLGRELMQRTMARCGQLYPQHGIRISAQAHLQRFYGALGFVAVGAPYDEDGIAHVSMISAPGRDMKTCAH